MPTPGLMRRLGGALYETLAIIALWMLASALVTSLFGNATHGYPRLLLQSVALLTISGYYLWCWTHGGQTLAMKTWRMRVVRADGASLNWAQALKRLLLTVVTLLPAGLGWWWALWDKDRQFLYDRLGGTRLVLLEKTR